MLGIDKLWHVLFGEAMYKGFNWLGLSVQDNAIISGTIMVGKELTDSVFCTWDIAFSFVGWFIGVM